MEFYLFQVIFVIYIINKKICMLQQHSCPALQVPSPTAQSIKQNKRKIRQNWRLQTTKLQAKKETKGNLLQIQESKLSNRKRKNSDCTQMNYLNSLKDLQVTKKFADQFQLGKKIGQGAQSVVYQCFSKESREKFIVKVIKNAEEEIINMITEHYRILKSLDYPSIIKGHYLYINSKEKTTHMVMQYCSYPDLRTFINQNPGLHEKIASQILQKILKVILYLHEKKVCHRDIKPQNILFDYTSGNIKLIDFQIAKMPKYSHQKLEMWTNTGTLHYRAPESFGGEYSESIDIWAVGVIAYELLVGKLPFACQYVRETIKQIKQKQIDWDQLDISSNGVDFLKKTLCKNSQERLTAAQALSCPLILKYKFCKNTIAIRTKNKKSLQGEKKQSASDEEQQTKFYDEEKLYSFRETINEDIGIRILKA